MELNQIQRRKDGSVVISVRVSTEHSDFMKENNISPTSLFNVALTEFKENYLKNEPVKD